MTIAIREFGYLVTSGESNGLECQVVSTSDFAFLKSLALHEERSSDVFKLTSTNGKEAIQAKSFVGLIRLPSGEQLEIVPKTTFGIESIQSSRRAMLKMLSALEKIEFRESGLASVSALNHSWLEILITHFLRSVARLAKSGLKKNYVRVHEEASYLRGRLRITEQIRLRPEKLNKFKISFDKYSLNRPENRLIHSALIQLNKWVETQHNQRLCRELLFVFNEVPTSSDYEYDLRQWSKSRDMAQYKMLEPWVQLILSRMSPVFSDGKWEGFSMLFPMEKMFEAYLESILKKQVRVPYKLKAQKRSKSLVEHKEKQMFFLQPDFVVCESDIYLSVLDAKWKLLDCIDQKSKKYGLSQSDFYQLFAYGEKYLKGEGDMYLIFPKNSKFEEPLEPFNFSANLRIWVVPLDLNSDEIIWPGRILPKFLYGAGFQKKVA